MRLAARALLFLLASAPQWALGSTLLVVNDTSSDLLNIQALAPGREDFFRLDLQPGASAEVENPGGSAALRFDVGLSLVYFPAVDLSEIGKLELKEGGSLVVGNNSGATAELAGQVRELAPTAPHGAACNLDNFRPAMSMGDVCSALPPEAPRDDNGALLAGMAFGGLDWAARLTPEPGPGERLQHIELRRVLDPAGLRKLVEHLLKAGYAPWQAELPGLEMDFGAGADAAGKSAALGKTLARFLENSAKTGHAAHSNGVKCDQAVVIFAPAAQLPDLEKEEEPARDALIYTLTLRPCANTMLLDAAAYKGSGEKAG